MSDDFILDAYFLRPDLYPEGAEIMERRMEKVIKLFDELSALTTK